MLVAIGLELLKTLGRLYVRHTEANPTYQVVAGSVGLLVFLNAINQLLLFAAALTATSTAGHPFDLAADSEDRRRPRPGERHGLPHPGPGYPHTCVPDAGAAVMVAAAAARTSAAPSSPPQLPSTRPG